MDMGATPPRKRGPHGTVTMPIINGRWWPQSLRHCRAPYPAALHALIKPPGLGRRPSPRSLTARSRSAFSLMK